MEIVSVKQKSRKLIRLCKGIIGAQGAGWEVGRKRSLQSSEEWKKVKKRIRKVDLKE